MVLPIWFGLNDSFASLLELLGIGQFVGSYAAIMTMFLLISPAYKKKYDISFFGRSDKDMEITGADEQAATDVNQDKVNPGHFLKEEEEDNRQKNAEREIEKTLSRQMLLEGLDIMAVDMAAQLPKTVVVYVAGYYAGTAVVYQVRVG
jgi:hypothetical protein